MALRSSNLESHSSSAGICGQMDSCAAAVCTVSGAFPLHGQRVPMAFQVSSTYTSLTRDNSKGSNFAWREAITSNNLCHQRKYRHFTRKRARDFMMSASNGAHRQAGEVQLEGISVPANRLKGSVTDIDDRGLPRRAVSTGVVTVSKERMTIEKQDLRASPGIDDRETLYIKSFLKGKHILVTGGTGGLGKVLVEKILRVQPDVAQLYLLIQERPDVTVDKRLEKNIIDSEVFRLLRRQYGTNYKEFMHQKLTALNGSLTSPALGLSGPAVDALTSKIDIIVNSAATTTLNERYDVALNVNTLGPQRVLEFAKQCSKIPLFLHVSTAYVNGKREGPIAEKPFKCGENIAQEIWYQTKVERKYFPVVDPHVEHKLADITLKEAEWKSLEKGQRSIKEQMVELGQKRAQLFGWHDSYTITKAMGEMLLEANKGHIPIAIVRPSIIESTYREPFAGWIEGVRMLDPILVAYGKGQMERFFMNPETVLDLIPADVVVNVIIATMAKHYGHAQMNPHVYQVASSNINPMTMSMMGYATHDHFENFPLVDNKGRAIHVERMDFHINELAHAIHLWWRFKLPSLTSKVPWIKKDKLSDKKSMVLRKAYETFTHLAQIYKPYTFFKGRFDASNSWSLLQKIADEEQDEFNSIDVKTINWHTYLTTIHIPGLRKYSLKGRGTKMPTIGIQTSKTIVGASPVHN